MMDSYHRSGGVGRRVLALLACVLLLCSAGAVNVLAVVTEIGSEALGGALPGPTDDSMLTGVYVVDVDTGSVLADKRSDESYIMSARSAFMMTAYIAQCEGELTDNVTISPEVRTEPYGIAQAGLWEGDVARLQDLISSMVVMIAQDSAMALAIHLSGSADAFLTKMNQYAQDLGMTSTRFTNVIGAHDERQVTTLRDLSILALKLYEKPASKWFYRNATIMLDSPNAHLGESVQFRPMVMDPKWNIYDSRVTAVYGGNAFNENNYLTILRAQVGDQDLLVATYAANGEWQGYEGMSTLLDELGATYAARDLTEDVRALLSDAEAGGTPLEARLEGTIIRSAKRSWELTEGLLTYELTDVAEALRPGQLYAQAQVFLEGEPLTTVPLYVPASGADASGGSEEAAPEPKPVRTPEPRPELQLYTPEDESYQRSFYDRYGWIFWVAGSALCVTLLGIVLSIASKRMR